MRPFASRLVIAAALLATVLSHAPHVRAQASTPGPRVVAIADIHGDAARFSALLRQMQLADAHGRWTGGTATLVQLGDMIDRGPASREVMDGLMSLQADAAHAGGRVIVLLGDHEAMNIYGDLAYVPASEYASFVDSNSERRRRNAWTKYAALFGGSPPVSHDAWLAAHPAGFIEQREAFGPSGRYGRWLRGLPAVALVGGTLFAHAGIGPDLAGWSVDRVNRTITGEIKTFDQEVRTLVDHGLALPFYSLEELVAAAHVAAASGATDVQHLIRADDWWSIRDEGPLWFRGYARLSDADLAPLVDRVDATYGASRIVVGHTVESGTVIVRAGGRVYLLDTGMLTGFVPGGRASALEITGAQVHIIYAAEGAAARRPAAR
ncbi:MAG: metallophosphoesterase [Vicinamibacterales bacterium]